MLSSFSLRELSILIWCMISFGTSCYMISQVGYCTDERTKFTHANHSDLSGWDISMMLWFKLWIICWSALKCMSRLGLAVENWHRTFKTAWQFSHSKDTFHYWVNSCPNILPYELTSYIWQHSTTVTTNPSLQFMRRRIHQNEETSRVWVICSLNAFPLWANIQADSWHYRSIITTAWCPSFSCEKPSRLKSTHFRLLGSHEDSSKPHKHV
jgi:hypothetical protein